MLRTPLHQQLAAQGAEHTDERGILLPRSFGDVGAEYAALCQGAAVVDLGFRTSVHATGDDRVGFLQGMLTCDVQRLEPGGGGPGLLLTIQGRVTADVRVTVLSGLVALDVDVRARQALVEALEKLIIADDVELGPPPEDEAVVGLEGPRAAALVGEPASRLEPFAHVVSPVGGVPVRILRASELHGPGFVLYVPVVGAGRVWDALVATGAHPCGMAALEARRIECGVPRLGLDMDGSTLAIELPVEDAISATKGCYLGQEVVARGTARGHVNRRLVGLTVENGDPPPVAGSPLYAGDREVGRLTSIASSPTRGDVALGLVRREHWEPGTRLVAGPGVGGGVRVTALPFA